MENEKEIQIRRAKDEQHGFHANDVDYTSDRLIKGNSYKDLSTIIIIPTRGLIHAKVVSSWWSMMMPMNQKVTRMFAVGMEVGEAYQSTIEQILTHPVLSNWNYILTLEEDNLPPPDGLIKLYENAEKYAAVGGIYWTKGEGGQPMIYGEGKDNDIHFRPQVPVMDIQECDGLGMGFTLFQMKIFKDGRIAKPWFQTRQIYEPGKGTEAYTQDLYFFERIRKLGYRVACDTRVRVGHLDPNTEIVW